MPRINPVSAQELEIARRFKAARQEARAPRSYVAVKLGVDSQSIVRIELGRVPLKYKLARDFCVAFQVSPAWLAAGIGSKHFNGAVPDAHFIGASDDGLFSQVYRERLAPSFDLRPAETITDLYSQEPGQRLWCIEQIAGRLKQWFRMVPRGRYRDLMSALTEAGNEFLKTYPRDPWDVEARRRADMDQMERLDDEELRPFPDLQRSDIARRVVSDGFRLSQLFGDAEFEEVLRGSLWKELLWRLRIALVRDGLVAELERDCAVTAGMVAQWQAGGAAPDAEMALRLFAWVAAEEIRSRTRETDAGNFPTENSSNELTEVTHWSNSLAVPGAIDNLIERLKRACEPRGSGNRKRLAKFLGVPMPRISEWLAGEKSPAGDTTLKLLQWVEAEEQKQPKRASVTAAPPSPKSAPKKPAKKK